MRKILLTLLSVFFFENISLAQLYGVTISGGASNGGTIFHFNTSSNTLITDISLSSTDNNGSNPTCISLTLFNGKYYGFTENGGTDNAGVIFEYDPVANTYTKKVNFDNLVTGGDPKLKLVQSGNKLYGATTRYAANGTGAFFEYDPVTNILTNKYDFPPDGYGQHTLTLLNDKFYGLGELESGNGHIFEWDPNTNIYSVKKIFDGINYGSYPAGNLTLSGNQFYGTTQLGGSNNNGVIFEWDPVSNVFTKKIDFDGVTGRIPLGNLVMNAGKFYGRTSSGGANNEGVIFEWDPVTNIYTKKIDFQTGDLNHSVYTSLTLSGGKFFGVTLGGDAGTIFEWDPVTNIYTKKQDFNGQNGVIPLGLVEYLPTVIAICPDTIYVDINSTAASADGISWPTAYKELRVALKIASECPGIKVINVAKGTYKPTDDNNRDSTFPILRGGLKIYGGFPTGGGIRDVTANLTILSGEINNQNDVNDNSYHVMVIAGLGSSADSLVVDGFTITGGAANTTAPSQKSYNGANLENRDGGGICVLSCKDAGGKIALRNCTISSNISGYLGGGMYIDGSSPGLDNCTFSSNYTRYGGGLFNAYGLASPVLTNCTFSLNTGYEGGGGIYNVYGFLSLVNCAFLSNSAATGGGGGLISLYDFNPINGTFASLTNCIFSGNTASYGGGIALNTQSATKITNCTFSDNSSTAIGSGGAINIDSDVVPNISNCIVYGNSSGIKNQGTGTPEVNYSLVRGGYPGTNNLSANPLFVNASDPDGIDNVLRTADDGLKVQPSSPAINMGSNAAVPTGITKDFAGSDRIQGGTVDMGAYEVPVLPTVFYSKSGGDLHNTATFGSNADGSGTSPLNFNSGTFNLANRGSVYTLTANWTVGGIINIPSGSQLQLGSFTLSEAGLGGTGTLSGSPTSNLVVTGSTGGDAGTLNFTDGSRSLNNLTLNRTGTSASATIGSQPLNLYGALTVSSGTLNTGDLLTLKSTATNTARVAPVGGNISGSVIVERYVPPRKAWRLLSAPVTGSQSVNQAWQEGATSEDQNPLPGYGTFITGGSRPNGFDQSPLATASIKSYDNNLVALPSTKDFAVNKFAYMTFVYGNRRDKNMIPSKGLPAEATTLRAIGPLKIGDQTFPVYPAGFTGIPNPFASPINFQNIILDNVVNSFTVWDPKMGTTGAYVTVSSNGNGSYDVTPTPVSPESQYIQSGQGFLVKAVTNPNPNIPIRIVIPESAKSATPAQEVFRVTGTSMFADPTKGQGLRVKLQAVNEDQSIILLDEVFSSYKMEYANKVDELDAAKASNIEENLGMVREGQVLVIERKPLPGQTDTITLKLWNTYKKSYLLEFNPVNLITAGLYAYLEDKYLSTLTPVSLSEVSQVYFTITDEASSQRTDRFNIILSKKSSLANFLTTNKGITAYPNPVVGSNVNLQFSNQEKGVYQVSIINNSGQVLLQRSVQHNGGSALQKLTLNKKLPAAVYQVRIVAKGTKITIPIVIQ